MKNSLICLSVLGLCAAAHAQSSVTLSGTADATLTRGTGSLTSRSGLGSGGNSTSKFALRGTENLGGGLSALFWLESGFLIDSGSGQATSANNQPGGTTAVSGVTFNRRAIVGLAGPWGEVHLGRDWAPMYDAYTGRYDPFGVGVGIALNYSAGITSQNGAVRVSNAVGYTTPKVLGGLSANLQHWAGENPSGTATGRDGTGHGMRLNYDSAAVSAAAHWGRTDYAAGDAVYRALAASYNFGPAKASAIVNHDSQGVLASKGWLVGGWMPLGAGEVKASYSRHRSDAAGEPTAKKLALGYVHNLSKRTALYTTLAHVRNSGGARQALNGATTGPNQSSRGFDLGIRHNF
ncbi:MAG: porin [Polaromonas sp.]|nr:porin [Polaromonas sp.]